MDWSRAKTILIIAFMLLNGFLGYQIYSQSQAGRWVSPVDADVVAAAEKVLLTRFNVALDVSLAIEVPVTSLKEVQRRRIDGLNMATKLLGGEPHHQQQLDEMITVYNRGRQRVIITDDIIVEFYGPSEGRLNRSILEMVTSTTTNSTVLHDQGPLIQALENLLGIDFSKTVLEKISMVPHTNELELVFRQYLDYPVFSAALREGDVLDASISIKVDSQGFITYMSYAWLDKVTPEGRWSALTMWRNMFTPQVFAVLPAYEVLLQYVTQGQESMVVERLELVYYGYDEWAGWPDFVAESFDLIPVWLFYVRFADGSVQKVFLNALDGREERPPWHEVRVLGAP